MWAIYVYAMVDRHLLSLLVEPLRADLGITDVQFGAAHGFGFALTLGLAGVQAGWLVDRGSRIKLLAGAIALWSVMTVLTGLANGFAMLLACRVGFALGQAALTPATLTLIAERFPPERLGLALGIFGMAPHFGVGFANLAGAAVIAVVPAGGIVLPALGLVRPWQLALAVVGIPGLLIAILVMRLNDGPDHCDRSGASDDPLLDAVAAYFLRHLNSFAFLKLATAFAAMAIYAITGWAATLLIRTHGWSISEAGGALGPLFLVAGALGALGGGMLGDWLHRRWPDGRVIAMMMATSAAIPFGISAPLQADPRALLALLGAAVLFAGMAVAINPAATMAIMPARMRGIATAIGVLIVNSIGLGCGPLAVALITDFGFGDPMALASSLAIVVGSSLAAAAACAALCRISYRLSIQTVDRAY